MTIYRVATLACYVLVEAENETEARQLGQSALEGRLRDERRDAPVVIRTVRPASADEIELRQWHQDATAHDHAE